MVFFYKPSLMDVNKSGVDLIRLYLRVTQASVGSWSATVNRRATIFLHQRYDHRYSRTGRAEILPLHIYTFYSNIVWERSGAITLQFYLYQPYRRNRVSCAFRIYCSYNNRLCEEWARIFKSVLDK